MNKIIVWTLVVLGGLFALFMLTAPTTEDVARRNAASNNNTDPAQSTLFDEEPIDIEGKPQLIIGDPDAPVTLVEYGDFKCPSCNSFHHGAGRQIRQTYVDSGRLKIEFRNFPFIAVDSDRTALGAYCAQEQGAFTAYHDRIYEYIWEEHYASGDIAKEFDDIYTIDKIIEVAGDTVPDAAALRTCIDSAVHQDNVNADIALASQDGIQGTPGFVLNGQPINGPQSYNTFRTLIEAQL